MSEANESKLSSEGEIRTDMSNTDESFNLDLEQYINFCDDPKEDNLVYSNSSRRRSRPYVLDIQDVDVEYSSSCLSDTNNYEHAEGVTRGRNGSGEAN